MARDGEAALIASEVSDTFANFRRLAKVARLVSIPILDANGNLISDKSQKLECGRDYYTGLLNRPNTPDFEQLITAALSATRRPNYELQRTNSGRSYQLSE